MGIKMVNSLKTCILFSAADLRPATSFIFRADGVWAVLEFSILKSFFCYQLQRFQLQKTRREQVSSQEITVTFIVIIVIRFLWLCLFII